MNGRVTPVSGITRVTPPTITNTWSASIALSPAASSVENESRASTAVLKPRAIEQQVGHQHRHGAEQPELVGDDRVDHVGLRRRQQRARRPGSVSAAWPKPCPNSPPAAWANIELATW